MSDLIRREDAIRAVAEVLSLNRFASFKNIKDFGRFAERMLRNVPSADRPQGKWLDKGKNLWKCSNCEMVIYSESEQDRNEFHKWCSRCGCRMKGADDAD